jgi:hypothetical protein
VCSIGVLRRRKFGVVIFVITYTIILIATPFIEAVRNQPLTSEKQGSCYPSSFFL